MAEPLKPHRHGGVLVEDGAWLKGCPKCRKHRRAVAVAEQPDPTPNDGTPIWDLVIADMHARDALGRERYGTPLQAHNGRDALQDAYEEALDLAAYLRQAIEERET